MLTPDEELEELRGAVRSSKTASNSAAALAAYYLACDEGMALLVRSTGVKLGCNDGCSHCCHQRVSVISHELFVIADYINRKCSEAEREAHIGRLKNHLFKIADIEITERDKTMIACPFLTAGRCSIYSVRPFMCRMAHATSSLSCARFWPDRTMEKPQSIKEINRYWERVIRGSDEIFREAGFDVSKFDLPGATLLAIQSAIPGELWMKGEFPFPRDHTSTL